MKLTANIQPMQRLRGVARRVGLISALEKRFPDPRALWARSIFSLHDIDDLIRLDVPWWTLRSIRIMDAYFRKHDTASCFEWGSGASTVWLAKRSGRVQYVEHHAGWKEVVEGHTANFDHVEGNLAEPPRIETKPDYQSKAIGLRKHDFKQYVHAVDAVEPQDVIVIDGRCRVRCYERAVPNLKDTGVIVFDNSNRTAYTKAIKKSGLPSIKTRGLTPCLPYPAETTLVFKTTDARDRMIDFIQGEDRERLERGDKGIALNGVPSA